MENSFCHRHIILEKIAHVGFGEISMCAAIDWGGFTWQAFATIFSGFLAVCAAVAVAIRQMKLQQRIANDNMLIQKHVASINEMTFREKLFDRRMAFFDTIRAGMDDALSKNPSCDNSVDLTEKAFSEAPFLFPPTVMAWIDPAIGLINTVAAAEKERERYLAEGWGVPDHVYTKSGDARRELYRLKRSMYAVFGTEMMLGH
ncbi:hypothetical protein [Stakelama tenebrarum]|uniref:Uncharacterized protein n=1 Tax=Stakelama tenebrarum TaxID=2711215 RepID=A0A6G6Y4V0_9SPHN|nr:hypothetical protein [Sphingosinithalassobacter tenebrarum]QIG79930.1 hypothetical protein G5C33_09160 [Sphingosinithalassobacter tenebrarum]